MAENTKSGKKNRKLGRQAHHPAHNNYNNAHVREHNKLKRVRQSNGEQAAEMYLARCQKAGIPIK
jgi:hypothetical protein